MGVELLDAARVKRPDESLVEPGGEGDRLCLALGQHAVRDERRRYLRVFEQPIEGLNRPGGGVDPHGAASVSASSLVISTKRSIWWRSIALADGA